MYKQRRKLVGRHSVQGGAPHAHEVRFTVLDREQFGVQGCFVCALYTALSGQLIATSTVHSIPAIHVIRA